MGVPQNSIQIRFISGPLHGKLIEIDQFPCTLGRELDNDIVLADDRVSRYHAVIEYINQAFYILDKDSHNGIQHQQHPIKKLRLEQGMRIQLGFSVIKIEVIETSPNSDSLS